MNRNYTLILAVSLFAFDASYAQAVYIDNGTATAYTLNTGDSLYISQGTYTGKITAQSKEAKITVATNASFKPSSINTYHSVYQIYGTAFFPGSISTQQGFSLDNYGAVTINGDFTANSKGGFTNNDPGVIEIKGALTFNNTNDIMTNYGEIIVQNNLNLNGSNGLFTNRGNFLIAGGFMLNNVNGQIQNEGYWYASEGINFNTNLTFTNTCRMVSGKAIVISSATIYNSGLLWSSSEQNASELINNSGTIISQDNGVIKTVKFTNYSIIKGNGFLYFTGQTTTWGTIGQSGNTSDTLRVYTVNRSNVNQIFDAQGTVHPNVIYFPFPAPDTLTSSSYPCYERSFRVLPVEWKDFSVKLSGGVPVVSWSVLQPQATYFEVQRSFDGNNFTSAAGFQEEQVTYEFSDKAVNMNQLYVVYYRVKASSPNGKESYSDVKMLRLENRPGNLHPISVSPNPFNSSLQIAYQAPIGGTIAIKVFNLQGQLQYHHRITANKGSNQMVISESSGWKSGIYVVAVYAENGLSSTAKVVKQ